MNAGVFSEIVGVSALVSIGAVVFVVKFFAGLLGRFWPVDLSPKGMGEVAAESILTVSHIIVDAGVKAPVDVFFATVLLAFAFFDCKVLVGAEVLDHFKLTFQLLVLQEFFVVHVFC